MSRARKIARRLPSVPGYRYARRTLLPRVRESSTARAVAKRIFELDVASGRMTDLAPGNLIAGIGTENLPVVVIVALDVPAEALPDLVDDVARRQVLTAGFRPVFVLGTPDFAAPRRYGYVTELIVPEETWPHEESWHDYVSDRLASIVGRYRASAALHIGRDGMTPAQALVLSSVGAPPQ